MPKNPVKHQCTFCKRIIDVRDQYDMPIYDPNTGFAICKDCVREINRYLDEHDASVSSEERTTFRKELGDVLEKTRPHLIKEYLDTYIINQDRAKKILAVAVYNHYKRMKYGYEKKEDEGTEIEKSNVIMLGPSGCGKTALLSHLSKLLDVPFAAELTIYWGRHTWATLAAGLDVPKDTIAAALGHGANTVTDVYIDFDRRKVDVANRRVIDLVLHGE